MILAVSCWLTRLICVAVGFSGRDSELRFCAEMVLFRRFYTQNLGIPRGMRELVVSTDSTKKKIYSAFLRMNSNSHIIVSF